MPMIEAGMLRLIHKADTGGTMTLISLPPHDRLSMLQSPTRCHSSSGGESPPLSVPEPFCLVLGKPSLQSGHRLQQGIWFLVPGGTRNCDTRDLLVRCSLGLVPTVT
nr:hypothetical protein 15E6.160 [imported] - Neurospora crassa [Neurospora crassa]